MTRNVTDEQIQKIIDENRGVLEALAAYDRGECVCKILDAHSEHCPVHGEEEKHGR